MSAASELAHAQPLRAPEIRIGPAMLHGTRTVHLVKDPRSGRFFQIGPKERFIVERLDGMTTLSEIGHQYAAEFGRVMSESSWSTVLSELWRRGFLATAPTPAADPAPARPQSAGRTLVLGDPGRLLLRVYPRLRWTLRPIVAVPVLLACLGMVMYLSTHIGAMWRQSHLTERPELAGIVICLMWASSVLHELGHGFLAHHYGGRATEIGVRLRGPVVAFYCEADDVLIFSRRWHRIATAFAGGVMNLVFLLPFFGLWLVLPEQDLTRKAITALLLLGSARALANYLPFPSLDGYLMVGHALNVVDLGPQTALYLRRRLRGAAREYSASAVRLYTAFAVLFTVSVLAAVAAVAWVVTQETGWPYRPAAGGVLTLLALVQAAAVLKRHLVAHRPAPAVEPAVTPSAIPSELPGRVPIPRVPRESGVSAMNVEKAREPVVVARELHKRYGDVEAVAGTSLSIAKGDFFGVLGPNGAGKTTLIEILEGQREPDSGTVEIFGQSPWPRNLELYGRIGVQTQSSAFFPELTALEHLEAIAGLYRLPRNCATRTLELIRLTDSAGVRVSRLSGGQRQRLAIASALVHEPELLFLDEPTAALDTQARRDLWALLKEIQRKGCTIVYTTHHMEEAEALCDRVAIVRSGSIVALGSPRELIVDHGGTTRILLPVATGQAALDSLSDEIAEVSEDGDQIEIRTTAPSRVLAALAGTVDLSLAEIRQPTLEDVYLNMTGTEYK